MSSESFVKVDLPLSGRLETPSNITIPCEPTGDRGSDTLFGHLAMSLILLARLATAVGFEPTTHGLTVTGVLFNNNTLAAKCN